MFGLTQTHIFPVLSIIFRSINAISIADGPLAVIFSSPYPDNMSIIGVDDDTTDGIGPILVKYWSKSDSCIDGLPNIPASHSHIIFFVAVRVDGKIGYASG